MLTTGNFLYQTLIVTGLFFFLIYRPGALLMNRFFPKWSWIDKVVIALILGIVIWVMAQFLLGYLGWLTAWPIISGVVFLLTLGQLIITFPKWELLPQKIVKGLSDQWLLLSIIILVALLQGSLHFFSGWSTDQGIVVHAFHSTDAPLHLSLIDQLSWRFPPEKPGFSGELFRNYHYLSDMIWAGIKRAWPWELDTMHLYFRMAPFLYSILISLTLFIVTRKITGQARLGIGAIIINGLTGGLGYLMPLLTNRNYAGLESLFWLSPPFSLFFNPGVVTGFFLMLAGCRMIVELEEKFSKSALVISALLLGAVIGFEVFAGLLILGALTVVSISQSIFKRQWQWLIVLLLTFAIAASLYLPNNIGGNKLVAFMPGYVLTTMVASPERMALLPFNLLKNWFVVKPWLLVLLMTGLTVVFVVGNLGIKVIGIVPIFKTVTRWKKSSPIFLYIAAICGASLTLPLVIGQFGVNWQPIQFGYYALLLMSITTMIQLDKWFEKLLPLQQTIIWTLVLLLGIPCIVHSLFYIRWGYTVSAKELEAYRFLQNSTDQRSAVLRLPVPGLRDEQGREQLQRILDHGEMMSLSDLKARVLSKKKNVKPLKPSALPPFRQPLRHVDAAFVAALSKRNSYLEDITTAQSMGVDYQPRLQLLQRLVDAEYENDIEEFLQKSAVDYIVLFERDRLMVELTSLGWKKVFDNQSVSIYKKIPE